MFENESAEKIQALFARFPALKNQWNAAAYNEKVIFWSSRIKELVTNSQSSKLSFRTLNLHQQFEFNGSIPLCIDTVLVYFDN